MVFQTNHTFSQLYLIPPSTKYVFLVFIFHLVYVCISMLHQPSYPFKMILCSIGCFFPVPVA